MAILRLLFYLVSQTTRKLQYVFISKAPMTFLSQQLTTPLSLSFHQHYLFIYLFFLRSSHFSTHLLLNLDGSLISSSSFIHQPKNYDVFLSFRSEDTALASQVICIMLRVREASTPSSMIIS